MSKFGIVLSDLQIHNYKAFDDNNRRLENTLKVLIKTFEYASSKGIEYILFAGDFFDQPKALPIVVINRTTEVLKNLFETYPLVKFIAITGNHDQSSRQLSDKDCESSLAWLNCLFDRFILIDNKSYRISVDQEFKGQLPVVIKGIPYYEYDEHFSKTLDSTLPEIDSINILLTHQVPSGLGNDMIKVDIEVNDPRLQGYDMVFNGHIHRHIKLADNFLSVGNPLHRDADDEGQDKGFLVVNLENPKLYKLVKLSDQFPNIITKYAGDQLTEWEANQYIREIPVPIENKDLEVEVENYAPSVKASDMLVNFCKDTGNDNKVSIGLTLI